VGRAPTRANTAIAVHGGVESDRTTSDGLWIRRTSEFANRILKEKREQCNALGWFRSQQALAWLEYHVESPIVGQWGHLAALSHISWSWILRWLEQGRPMSLVALDALINCCRHNTPMLKLFAPRLQDPAPFMEMKQRLEAYAAVDRVPRVEQAVRSIVRYWEAGCLV